MSGESPFLGSVMVGPAVQGIQSNGVIATAKHYILNNQEWCRGNVSADVDERTIMEIYQPPFAAAIAAGVGSIMCGYNRINGVWVCEALGCTQRPSCLHHCIQCPFLEAHSNAH